MAEHLAVLAVSEEEQLRLTAEANEVIAECMHEAGFDYVEPYTPDGQRTVGQDLSDDEFAAQYGYGISTVVGADADIHRDTDDQSAAYTSEHERALYGDGAADDESAAYDWSTQGCMGRAYHEVLDGQDQVLAEPAYLQIEAALTAALDRADQGPEAADLREQWTVCMDGHVAGPTAEDPQGMAMIFQERRAVLGSEADPAELADLQREEIAAAIADQSCRREIDYDDRHDQIVWAVEAQIVAEFRAELDALNTERRR